MDYSAYPNLSFKLNCGRTVRVHALIWQPALQECLEVKSGKDTETIMIERKEDLYWRLFGKCPVHVVNAEYVDIYINHPPRLPNTTITVLLSSEPLSGGLYSELVVELYMDYVEGLALEAMLQKYLDDLDWEELAVDVVDQTIKAQNKPSLNTPLQ